MTLFSKALKVILYTYISLLQQRTERNHWVFDKQRCSFAVSTGNVVPSEKGGNKIVWAGDFRRGAGGDKNLAIYS